MIWQFFISSRYLTSKRRERFISMITAISVFGIAIGVFALVVVMSVMSGFHEDLKDKIIGVHSHIEILSDYGISPSKELTDAVLGTKHVVAASYFLNSQALLHGRDTVSGVIVKGIVPSDELRVEKLGQYLKEGALELRGDSIVLGTELADKLNIKIGDTVSLISPSNIKPKDMLTPGNYSAWKAFKVTGIFKSGMYEYDLNLVYIHLEKAQGLLGTGAVASGMAVRVDDLDNVADVRQELTKKLGFPYNVRTWIDSNKNFLEAIKLEKTMMFIVITLIVMVACFNIASTLIMTVLEKTKDIGILKAIGASNRDIMAVFALQGGIIGFIGTAVGTLSGIGACWCLKTYKFITLPSDIYYIDKLPVRMEAAEILLIISVSFLISIASAIYPAYKASQLDPVEALRYE